MSRTLILARHGESEGNLANVFTGWTDVDLTARGAEQARAVGMRLQTLNIRIRHAFSSALRRTHRSAELVLAAAELTNVAITADAALNERDYGELTGIDKGEARLRWGKEAVQEWRRSYDRAPPGGESLRDTVARVVPFYLRRILPCVMRSEPVLVVAHGNSLRALIMALEGIDRKAIPAFELVTGETIIYRLASDTTIQERKVFSVD